MKEKKRKKKWLMKFFGFILIFNDVCVKLQAQEGGRSSK
jgi:hypothetical protein